MAAIYQLMAATSTSPCTVPPVAPRTESRVRTALVAFPLILLVALFAMRPLPPPSQKAPAALLPTAAGRQQPRGLVQQQQQQQQQQGQQGQEYKEQPGQQQQQPQQLKLSERDNQLEVTVSRSLLKTQKLEAEMAALKLELQYARTALDEMATVNLKCERERERLAQDLEKAAAAAFATPPSAPESPSVPETNPPSGAPVSPRAITSDLHAATPVRLASSREKEQFWSKYSDRPAPVAAESGQSKSATTRPSTPPRDENGHEHPRIDNGAVNAQGTVAFTTIRELDACTFRVLSLNVQGKTKTSKGDMLKNFTALLQLLPTLPDVVFVFEVDRDMPRTSHVDQWSEILSALASASANSGVRWRDHFLAALGESTNVPQNHGWGMAVRQELLALDGNTSFVDLDISCRTCKSDQGNMEGQFASSFTLAACQGAVNVDFAGAHLSDSDNLSMPANDDHRNALGRAHQLASIKDRFMRSSVWPFVFVGDFNMGFDELSYFVESNNLTNCGPDTTLPTSNLPLGRLEHRQDHVLFRSGDDGAKLEVGKARSIKSQAENLSARFTEFSVLRKKQGQP